MYTISKYNLKALCLGLLVLGLTSCTNPWDNRTDEGSSTKITANLNEAISSLPQLTKFEELLVQTGYDKIIAASKTYTVFAPSNDALAQIDPAILNDVNLLTQFVQNHIAVASYSSIRSTGSEKIKMLSGKYLEFKGSDAIGEATITAADKGATNGILHIINKVLAPKLNIWEYLNARKASSLMASTLIGLNTPVTYKNSSGELITTYADSLYHNFFRKVYDISNEKNKYTLFLMEDSGYTAEFDKLSPYLVHTSSSFAKENTDFYTIRDMVFPNAYSLNQLPTSLVSRFGIKVPIDKTQIVGDPIVLSNGIVYIVKKLDVPLVDRLQTTIIEGENPTDFSDRTKVQYRVDPTFKSIIISDSKRNYLLNYRFNFFFSTKYKVYARVPYYSSFGQKLVLGLVFNSDGTPDFTGSIKDFGELGNMAVNNTDEFYVGEYTFDSASNSNSLTLVGTTWDKSQNKELGTSGNARPFAGGMFLDYLKFVPVLK